MSRTMWARITRSLAILSSCLVAMSAFATGVANADIKNILGWHYLTILNNTGDIYYTEVAGDFYRAPGNSGKVSTPFNTWVGFDRKKVLLEVGRQYNFTCYNHENDAHSASWTTPNKSDRLESLWVTTRQIGC